MADARIPLWTHPEMRSRRTPNSPTKLPFDLAEPLVQQAGQCVIRGEEPPLVTARVGLAALDLIGAVKRAAASGAPVRIEEAA